MYIAESPQCQQLINQLEPYILVTLFFCAVVEEYSQKFSLLYVETNKPSRLQTYLHSRRGKSAGSVTTSHFQCYEFMTATPSSLFQSDRDRVCIGNILPFAVCSYVQIYKGIGSGVLNLIGIIAFLDQEILFLTSPQLTANRGTGSGVCPIESHGFRHKLKFHRLIASMATRTRRNKPSTSWKLKSRAFFTDNAGSLHCVSLSPG